MFLLSENFVSKTRNFGGSMSPILWESGRKIEIDIYHLVCCNLELFAGKWQLSAPNF